MIYRGIEGISIEWQTNLEEKNEGNMPLREIAVSTNRYTRKIHAALSQFLRSVRQTAHVILGN